MLNIFSLYKEWYFIIFFYLNILFQKSWFFNLYHFGKNGEYVYNWLRNS